MNEVDKKVLTEFEKVLERDHGVSRTEDRQLVIGLWANLDEEDKSFACSDLKTGLRDLVSDAVESPPFQHYMASKRGRVKPSSKGAATPESGGLNELFSSGGITSDNKLKAKTRSRVEALSYYLSKIIAADREVVFFRTRVLGAPTKTLSPEDATALIHSLAAEQQPRPQRDAETLWWSGSDDAPRDPTPGI